MLKQGVFWCVARVQQGWCYVRTRIDTLSTCRCYVVTLKNRINGQATPYEYANINMRVLSYMYMCNSKPTYLCVCVLLYIFK